MFYLEIFSCIVWGTWKTQEIDEGLNFKVFVSSHAYRYPAEYNIDHGEGWQSEKSERRKLAENLIKIVMDLQLVL